MTSRPTAGRRLDSPRNKPSPRQALHSPACRPPEVVGVGLIGIALFVVGGMMLEDAMDSDWLTFAGLLAVGGGLLGIVAGGVSVGMYTRNRD